MTIDQCKLEDVHQMFGPATASLVLTDGLGSKPIYLYSCEGVLETTFGHFVFVHSIELFTLCYSKPVFPVTNLSLIEIK